jgi:23S rRNA (cytidine2498-2'-O)-methyltransferase
VSLLLQCRPGFEAECAAEIQARMAERGVTGYCRAVRDAGYVEFETAGEGAGAGVAPAWRELVFARQLWPVHARLASLPEADRIAPLLAALPPGLAALSGVTLEHPDTNDGKSVGAFLRKFERPFVAALARAGVRLDVAGAPRLHAFFTDSRHAWLGFAEPARAAPWPMGVPRLKFPREAPSRSTLKLDEAFQALLTAAEREAWLAPGLRAVDLGAAPGGWTYQFVRRQIAVIAVDNGPMDERLLDSGLVEHRREDGFRYRPSRAVDWLVCDMVEQPQRVATLVAGWLADRACRRAVFNLKLPMKKRQAMVEDCLALLRERLGPGLDLRCKQLYHDREEVTVFAAASEARSAQGA